LMGDDFERDSCGRIKGSYTVDGFFEPDWGEPRQGVNGISKGVFT
jgi:hypothetical protein